jgi:hypothetical protein
LNVESYGFDRLAEDLAGAEKDIRPKVAKVTGKACNNIKKDVKKRWTGLAHLPHLPRAINYDVKTRTTEVVGQVGADHALTQGKLAWTQEYGTPTSSPHPAFRPAAEKEVPVWLDYLDRAAVDALGATGD